jgi:hypothetical protein
MILQIGIYILSALMSLSGLALTFISLPGVWLIYASTIIISAINNFQIITPQILVILFFVSLLSTFIDNIINAIGVKALGGSIWGMIGAILGGLVGVFLGNIIGIIIAPLLGAFLFEYLLGKKGFKKSLKAGFGTFVGMFFTAILKTGINIAMIVYIFMKLISK